MVTFLPIIIGTIGIFLIVVYLGNGLRRKSVRAATAFTGAGLCFGLVLIVDYFQEVPVIIFAAIVTAFVATVLFAAFEIGRKEAASLPN